MQITLSQFEAIEGLHDKLMRDPFDTCLDPRQWVQDSNRLLDYCIDAVGRDVVDGFAGAMDCAAYILAEALIGTLPVCDEVAA